MSNFEIGDIVRWDTKAGAKEYAIVQIWDKDEPKQILVTDTDHVTMQCNIALLCDCTLVSKGNVETKTFKRHIETAKPIVEHIIGRD